MSSASIVLPEGFENLSQYGAWAISRDEDRIAKRLETPFEEVVAFYDAVIDQVYEAMQYLSTRPVNNPSIDDINLVNILKSMAEIANAVEIYHQGPIPDAGDLRGYVSRINRDLVGSDLNE